MELRWYFHSLIVLLSINDRANGGITDSIKDGVKLIKNSVVYTIEDIYGGLGFGEDLLKYANEEVHDQTPSNKEEYDFIVVGAGSSGSAVAARLSEIENAKVLLIEAGGHESLALDIPALGIANLVDPLTDWHLKTEPSNDFCLAFKNNQCVVHLGKVMGGTSVINLVMACRGTKNDYDKWGEATGDSGWSYEGMLEYFKKLENADLSSIGMKPDPKYRGTGGPVNIMTPPYRTPLADSFVKAGEELGFHSRDYNGEGLTGFNYLQSNQKNGQRMSANTAYLHPIRDRKNLIVSMDSHVNKVIIDPKTKTAKGVEFTKHGHKKQVFAKKEVILSAGAIHTPQLLMLSGIGPADHLREMGIKVLADLPVGENLQDHAGYGASTYLINDTVVIDLPDFLNPANPAISQYLTTRDGILTLSGGLEALAYVNIDNMSPDDDEPDVEVMLLSVSLLSSWTIHAIFEEPEAKFQEMFGEYVYDHAYMLWPFLLKPKSRGKVVLRSSDPADPPKIYPKYFEDPDDVRKNIKAIRLANKISQTQAMQKYNATLLPSRVWGCEGYEPDSDDYWTCAMRTFTATIWHYTGTAKMGKDDDPSAVVNPKLQVRGIKKLRVIDTSIMPDIVVAHTNIPAMAIGEKGADLIKKDHGYIK